MSTEANEIEAPKNWQPTEDFSTERAQAPFSAADIFGKPGDFNAMSIIRSSSNKADGTLGDSSEQSLSMDNIFLAFAPVPPEGPKPPTVAEMRAQERADFASKQEFPGLDPVHARCRELALKEKLGDEPLSLDQAKFLYAERFKQEGQRMFPTDAKARDLYVKDRLASSSYKDQPMSDTPLTKEEKEQRDKDFAAYRARVEKELDKDSAPVPDSDTDRLNAIAEKKAAFLSGNLGAKPLTPAEEAFFVSKIEFPKDKHLQKLAETEAFHRLDPEQPGLNHAQTAELNAKREFPEPKSAYYANLAAKEALSINGKGQPPLTPEETADLRVARELPPNANPYTRALAKKAVLSESGGPALTLTESATLASTKEFPNDFAFRQLAEKALLAESGGAKLTPEETAALASKREFPYKESHRLLAEKEHLFNNAGLGAGLTPDEQIELNAARLIPRRP